MNWRGIIGVLILTSVMCLAGGYSVASSCCRFLHGGSTYSNHCSCSSLSETQGLFYDTACVADFRNSNIDYVARFPRKLTLCSTWGSAEKKPWLYRRCSAFGCSKWAHHGWEGGEKEFCAKHKIASMVNLSKRLCTHPDKCRKVASFGLPGDYPTHCWAHKLENMENLISPRCQEPGCNSINPAFDVPGGKGTYCSSHKKLGMLDVKSPRCQEPGCDIHASFGDPESRIRLFCTTHKLKHMVMLKGKKAGKT